MSMTEINLPIGREKTASGNHLLGILGVFAAPMLLWQSLFGSRQVSSDNALLALLGVFYIGGWICGAIGMFRQSVYGRGLAGKIVFGLQIILLSLAFSFSVMDTFGFNYENSGLFFAVCDAGYPLSHLFMAVVGIFVWRAKVWRDFARFAPFIVGFALPLTLLPGAIAGPDIFAVLFAGLTAAGLGIIGYTVYRKS